MPGTTHRSVITAPTLALIAVLVVFAAGCGGSSDKKANEAYANSVCSAFGTWQQQIKSLASNLTSDLSKASLQSTITQAGDATKMLATQIKAVPPPNTSDGQAAKKQVDQLVTQATSSFDSAKSAVASIPAGASAGAIATALAPLAPQIQSLASTAKDTLDSLQTAKGSLSSAFKSASSCKNLSG